MLFRDEETGMYIPLEVLAMKLAPLLAQQPAPAAVPAVPAVPTPDWSTAPEWAQWWAMDEIGLAWWYEQKPECCRATWESTLGHYKEDTSAEQAKSYPAWRDSLAQRPQVADANFWRAAFEDAKRDADQLRERVAELEAIIDRRERQNVTLMRAIEGMADSRDRLAAQVATATAERDEARQVATQHAERLEAIPWAGLAAWATLARVDSPVRKWFNANRPTTEADS